MGFVLINKTKINRYKKSTHTHTHTNRYIYIWFVWKIQKSKTATILLLSTCCNSDVFTKGSIFSVFNVASMVSLMHVSLEKTTQNAEHMVGFLGNLFQSSCCLSFRQAWLWPASSTLNKNKNNNKTVGNAEYLMLVIII